MATVCITGANRGIGLKLARQFSERGDQVTAVCRTASAGLIARIDELTLETSGSFWHANGELLPW